MVILATRAASSAPAFAQNTPKSSPHPAIFGAKGRGIAVLEVAKPSLQSPVEVFDNDLQVRTVGPPRLGTNRVSKFPEALLPRPFSSALEVSQKEEFDKNERPGLQLSS